MAAGSPIGSSRMPDHPGQELDDVRGDLDLVQLDPEFVGPPFGRTMASSGIASSR